MSDDFISAHRVVGVRTKADGTAVALEVEAGEQRRVSVEIPAHEMHALMREFLSAVGNLPPEDPAAESARQAYPATGYGVGPGFPDSVILALRTPQFGQQGFALDPDTARRVADELRQQADQVEAQQQTPH
ncbi:MAG: hypothetical protein GWN37_12780 [Gammaproteobacteria bacterium]|nr:hypothetical protein [Gammaproteobacteria bacterium]